MKYRLIETSDLPSKHFDKLNSSTKYRLLTVEEARDKARYCRGKSNVTFGYDQEMYDHIKGDLPYDMLELYSDRSGRNSLHVAGKRRYTISVDMVEPYAQVIKYNKDKL